MDSPLTSAHKLDHNVFTIRQQVNYLTALLEKKKLGVSDKSHDLSLNDYANTNVSNEHVYIDNNKENVDDALNNCNSNTIINNELSHIENDGIQKRPFLKKGDGLRRYQMKSHEIRVGKKKGNQVLSSESTNVQSFELYKNSDNIQRSPVSAFEILEERANDSSFCSTTSSINQLMEDSVKSPAYTNRVNSESKSLSVIDEESSYRDSSFTNFNNKYQDPNNCFLTSENSNNDCNSIDCGSSCCCEDTPNLMSQSFSLYTEQTSVYSPSKSETSRTTIHAQIVKEYNEKELDELRSTMEIRARELQEEIDAFKIESSYLNKLKSDYEREYNAFCEERMQLLTKIREERLKGEKELEEEKKKIASEKMSFERYMRECKSKLNKYEKEELRVLKEEISFMKDEMNKKESRWGAAQARIRTEMKMLKDLNKSLQEELNELKKPKKKVTFAKGLKKSKSCSVIQSKYKKEATVDNISNLTSESIHPVMEQRNSPIIGTFDYSNTFDNTELALIEEQLLNKNNNQFQYCKSISTNNSPNADQNKDDSSLCYSIEPSSSNSVIVTKESVDGQGNREKVYEDGRKEIWCVNGSVKKISPDGKIVKIIYYNGDVEEVLQGKQVKYYFAETQTWHTTFSDSADIREVKEFSNGQIEKYFHNGYVEIVSPDGTTCKTSPNGDKKWTLINGMTIIEDGNKKEKRTIFPNGEVETHTSEFKKRLYPDGTEKTIYQDDGRQETKYANGRIRIRDSDGHLISDTHGNGS